ncbi:MAG: bifunctional phosphoribosyl-AMP cyclohydrolase/phosphoribosyl-ATP diphosphatase HisIE [Cyclobacteriaceae bacterium]
MNIDFDKGNGLVPAIVQDHITGKVLMLGYMNEEAIAQTKSSGKVTFYSRSKERLWTKGESSGNFLTFKNMMIDCDQDALLIKAIPTGPVCHKGSDTCFKEDNSGNLGFIAKLEEIIKERRESDSDQSYTASLFRKGINKIAQKVGEEAVEVVIEAKDDNDELFTNESADLFFHYLILLQAKGFQLKDILSVLESRHAK